MNILVYGVGRCGGLISFLLLIKGYNVYIYDDDLKFLESRIKDLQDVGLKNIKVYDDEDVDLIVFSGLNVNRFIDFLLRKNVYAPVFVFSNPVKENIEFLREWGYKCYAPSLKLEKVRLRNMFAEKKIKKLPEKISGFHGSISPAWVNAALKRRVGEIKRYAGKTEFAPVYFAVKKIERILKKRRLK